MMLDEPKVGMHYPGGLSDLRAWFPDDAACLDYLDWLRWPDGFACPHCGSGVAWRLAVQRTDGLLDTQRRKVPIGRYGPRRGRRMARALQPGPTPSGARNENPGGLRRRLPRAVARDAVRDACVVN